MWDEHLRPAEAWVAQPRARQLLVKAPEIPAAYHFALRVPFGYSEAAPYHPFRIESAVEGTKMFDNAQSPPAKPME
jgi:hypothetical protein